MAFFVQMGEDQVPFLKLDDYQLRLDLEDLSDSDKERARNELRESPENVSFGMRKLREHIKGEPGLNLPINDEKFLLKFLRPCKYYPDSSFRVLKRFYKFKLKHPKLGADLTPGSVRHVFDEEVFFMLPCRTPCGARIMVANIGTKWNPKKVTLQDMFRSIMSVIEIAMMEPKTQLGGVHVILNMQGFSLIHVYQFSPHMAKLIVDWVQECTPIRLKGIHIIDQPYVFNMAYAIFKPFMGEKLKRKLFFHGTNRSTLCEKIASESLPLSLGGTANIPEYPGNLFSEMLFHYEDTFKVINSYCYKIQEKATAAD